MFGLGEDSIMHISNSASSQIPFCDISTSLGVIDLFEDTENG